MFAFPCHFYLVAVQYPCRVSPDEAWPAVSLTPAEEQDLVGLHSWQMGATSALEFAIVAFTLGVTGVFSLWTREKCQT